MNDKELGMADEFKYFEEGHITDEQQHGEIIKINKVNWAQSYTCE